MDFPNIFVTVSLLLSCLVIQMSFVMKNLYFLKNIKHLQLFFVLCFPGILPISTCKFVLLLPLLCRMLCSSQRNPYFSSHKLLYLFSHTLNYFFGKILSNQAPSFFSLKFSFLPSYSPSLLPFFLSPIFPSSPPLPHLPSFCGTHHWPNPLPIAC